jgi:hypothetical protein
MGATAGLVLAFSGPAASDTMVKAKITQLNKSGVSGTASLAATDDGRPTVEIHNKGLVPG